MYESWFHLSRRPYSAPPQTADYFADRSIETAREALLRCIERNAGPGVVIGGHGVGKTLLGLLLQRQCRSVRRVAHVSAPGIESRKELMQTILFEFGLPYNLQDEGQLRLSLIDFLVSAEPSSSAAVLIVDDAHELDIPLMEQLASFSDLVQEGRWCVNLVLLGQPALEDKLNTSSLASLSQRIAARYYLRGWNGETTREYVRFQLRQAGARHEIFDDNAIEAVYSATSGIPRLINQLCDHAMILASLARVRSVDSALVQEAWGDLQSIPPEMLMNTERSSMPNSDPVVEFGSLDDAMESFESGQNDSTKAVEDSEFVQPAGEAPKLCDQGGACAGCHVPGDEREANLELPIVTQAIVGGPTSGDDAVLEDEAGLQEYAAFEATEEFQAETPHTVVGPEMAMGAWSRDATEAEFIVASPASQLPNSEEPGMKLDEDMDTWHAATPAPRASSFAHTPEAALDEIERRLLEAEQQTLAAQTQFIEGDLPEDEFGSNGGADLLEASTGHPTNPFLESFEEEEIVMTRSSGLRAEFVTRQPSVRTEQGAALSDMLDMLEGSWGTPSVDLDLDERTIATPEIREAVASAVATHDMQRTRESDAAFEIPVPEDPIPELDCTTPQIVGGDYTDWDGYPESGEVNEIVATNASGDRSPYQALEMADEEYVIAGFNASDHPNQVVVREVTPPPIDEPQSKFVAPCPQPDELSPDPNEVSSLATQSTYDDEAEQHSQPPIESAEQSSENQQTVAKERKPERFGKLFSGLRRR